MKHRRTRTLTLRSFFLTFAFVALVGCDGELAQGYSQEDECYDQDQDGYCDLKLPGYPDPREKNCDDIDEDGICDDVDPECTIDHGYLACGALPPRCEQGLVPVFEQGCWSGCVSWEHCGRNVRDEVPVCEGMDSDRDGICDDEDEQCNQRELGADDVCLDVDPECNNPEEVPQIVEGCWTGGCVTWAQCRGEEPLEPPCEDSDEDGICNQEDDECTRSDGHDKCDRLPPTCDVDQVPVFENGCWGGCVTWDQCEQGEPGTPQCSDVDRDGTCDVDDRTCSLSESMYDCVDPTPFCEEGTFPVLEDGCWNGCADWASCSDLFDLSVQ